MPPLAPAELLDQDLKRPVGDVSRNAYQTVFTEGEKVGALQAKVDMIEKALHDHLNNPGIPRLRTSASDCRISTTLRRIIDGSPFGPIAPYNCDSGCVCIRHLKTIMYMMSIPAGYHAGMKVGRAFQPDVSVDQAFQQPESLTDVWFVLAKVI